VVPENFVLGDRASYLDAFRKVREALSPDGMFPEAGPKTALQTLQAFEPDLAGKNIDLSRTFTNALVLKANAKYK
jgi:NitT/TauT family transport system substrate-binding protein